MKISKIKSISHSQIECSIGDEEQYSDQVVKTIKFIALFGSDFKFVAKIAAIIL